MTIGTVKGTNGTKETLNFTGAENFQYFHSFKIGYHWDEVNWARDVYIGSKLWHTDNRANPIINAVFHSGLKDCRVKSMDDVTLDQNFFHWTAESVSNYVVANTNTAWNDNWFKSNQGNIEDVFVTIGNVHIEDCTRVSVHYDKTAAHQIATTSGGASTWLRDVHLCSILAYTERNNQGVAFQWDNVRNFHAHLSTDAGKFISVVKDVFPSKLRNGGNGIADTSNQHDEANNRRVTVADGYSSIIISKAAAADVATGDYLEALAGRIHLTGAGSVAISSMSGVFTNMRIVDRVLEPVSGLDISIATNNVASGFIQKTTAAADGTNGEVIVAKRVNDRWFAMG